MKHLTSVLMILLFASFLQAQNNDYHSLWNEVESLEIKGLPKSALQIVNQIEKKAKKDKNDTQQIKVLLFKSKFALILEEDAQLKIINDFKTEIAQSSFPKKNIAESILAQLYWQYFQQNRYRFYNRTNTAAKVDNTDFRTWDLQTLFNEIQLHFSNSLQNALESQNTSITLFSDLLTEQPDSEKYRPTLYDFLAHQALKFYKSDENTIAQPAYKFEIDKSDFIAPAQDFSNIFIASKDSTSLQLLALKTYQNLIKFHLNDPSPEALTVLNIERLKFVSKHGVFQDKEKKLLQTLLREEKQIKSHPISGLYSYQIASLHSNQAEKYNAINPETNIFRWKNQKALEICNEVINAFPKSIASQKCKVLKNDILTPYLSLTTEAFLPVKKPARILISYKNTNSLYFTVFSITQKQLKKFNTLYGKEKKQKFINNLTSVNHWETVLKDENDYQKHSTEVLLPPLDNGSYLILASDNKSGLTINNSFAYASVQVTDWALTAFKDQNRQYYQVINRNNGKPIVGASVKMTYKKKYNSPEKTMHFITDSKGMFSLEKKKSNYYKIDFKITHKDQTAYYYNFYSSGYYHSQNQKKPEIKPYIFTDRSIYRPGQTVYFKAIVLLMEKGKSSVVPHKKVYATLYNVNDEDVSELELTTNEYGSVAGDFILPSGGLTGEFYIELDSDDLYFDTLGTANFSVEEYKRPKFETQFLPVTQTYQVNDTVTVQGKAKAYSGSAVSNAKVVYRVKRTVQYPRWYYWYRPWFNTSPQEITHGETQTNDQGEYKIAFKAIPDSTNDKKNLPVFTYEVTADITDLNGETRSTSTMVKVGYHSLLANVIISDKINKNSKNISLKLETKNLNGEFVPATGTITFHKLIPPKEVLRKRPWQAPDYQVFTREEFHKLFPHDAYFNKNQIIHWKKGNTVFTEKFDTGKNSEIILKKIKKWQSGNYLIELKTQDKNGNEVKNIAYTYIYSTKNKTVPDNQLFTITKNKKLYKPGDKVALTLGTASKDVTVTIIVEKNNTITYMQTLPLNNTKKTVFIPVTKNDIGGFFIHYSFSVFNGFNSGSIKINVPYPKTDLQIETLTFRDKLQPGQEETWSFKIKGPKGDQVNAELLASMYDASLDQFKPHNWLFDPIVKPKYIMTNSIYTNSFRNTNFNVYLEHKITPNIIPIQFSKLNWFGFSLSYKWMYNNYIYRLKDKLITEYKSFIKKGVVEGYVVDKLGVPLPGVVIMVEGKNIVSRTDFDGKFTINSEEGDTLVFTYVGFEITKIKISKKNFYRITLFEDSSSLDEVIITAQGIRKEKKAMGYAVSMVADEDSVNLEESFEKNINSTKTKDSVSSFPDSLKNILIRKNLQETAFFFPQLQTDKEGNIQFSFTTPEALTRWKLQLLAHTKTLESSVAQFTTVTQKELMVTPNLPRFFRQGDTLTISSKISNISNKDLFGQAKIILLDALTNKDITNQILLGANFEVFKEKESLFPFTLPAEKNTAVSWKVFIPEQYGAITCKIIAKAGDFSDGEQTTLPVLSNRMLVTETLPMWLRSNQTKTFTLNKLKNLQTASGTTTSLKNHKLTLEMTSNPAWYAVQALPYLMEYPYECNEQTFSRYYANALATHIAQSYPRIQEVFNQWKNSDALLSNLEKNQELKSILIKETPWLRDAQSETEQKKRIALLFDLNKMKNELVSAEQKLIQNQLSNGGWSWFKGGRDNRFITQHIATGFGHLKKLNVVNTQNTLEKSIIKAISYLDKAFVTEYKNLKKYNKDVDLSKDHLSYSQLHYLYMRSFFPELKKSKQVTEISDYYLGQIKKYWLSRSLYAKGLMVLITHRSGDSSTTKAILKSLQETSITSEELGMYWKENTASWYWYQAPIETQALLIEAFSEAGTTLQSEQKNIRDIDNLKIWLLKNKQTNRWKTTKATSEAVYALLLQGNEWLSVTDMVGIVIGGEKIEAAKLEDVKVEAGTGYFKTAWNASEISPEMATVTLTKKGKGIAWGALYWQYFEDLDKITPTAVGIKTPLQLSKKLFVKKNTDTGEQLTEITKKTPVKVGDLVRVRIELKIDRPMEFVHLKDMRAAGFEPVNVLSHYKWQDGLGYYESTKDTSTDFFFDYLPKGVYVFEYDVRANNAGDFSNGISTIQSMYAPEFSSHSEGVRVKVK